MEMIIVMVALILFVVVSRYYGKRVTHQMGSNIAEKHFKEEWGMEANKEENE